MELAPVADELTGTNRPGNLQRFLYHRPGMISAVVLLLLIGVAILAPVIVPHNPVQQSYGDELLVPSSQYLLGTDDLGRDILSRIVYGIRVSLTVAAIAAFVGGTVGLLAGLFGGYWEGWMDDVLGRIWDTLLAFPALLIGLSVAVLLGPGISNAALAAAIINIPIIARITRAGVIAEKAKEYSLAAQATGASNFRILFLHILPNVFPSVLVQLTLTMAHSMILEAGLSFLGLGAQPPTPSLGIMLRNARSYMMDAVWFAVFPGLALTLLLLSISFLADAIRDVFDPHNNS